MAIKIMTAVWDLNIHPSQKMLLLAIADDVNTRGYGFPGRKRLANRCSVSVKTVDRQLSALKAAGLVVVEARQAAAGDHTSNGYQLNLDLIFNSENKVQGGSVKLTPPSDTGVATVGTPVSPPCLPVNRILNTQPIESAIPSEKVLLSERSWFSAWWSYSFKVVTGESYFLGSSGKGSDTGIISNLFRQGDMFDIVTRACSYMLKSDSDRWPKGPPTLFGFNKAINKLAGSYDEVIDRCIVLKLLPDFVISADELVTWLPWDKNYQKELKGACHGEN